mmetsp:Transcript_170548/g.547025  ORF Transcript_170548/g.547025 Transcript_170548/m.547025 type:complete len:212 (+) Transcript_170548:2700-3335(+)
MLASESEASMASSLAFSSPSTSLLARRPFSPAAAAGAVSSATRWRPAARGRRRGSPRCSGGWAAATGGGLRVLALRGSTTSLPWSLPVRRTSTSSCRAGLASFFARPRGRPPLPGAGAAPAASATEAGTSASPDRLRSARRTGCGCVGLWATCVAALSLGSLWPLGSAGAAAKAGTGDRGRSWTPLEALLPLLPPAIAPRSSVVRRGTNLG